MIDTGHECVRSVRGPELCCKPCSLAQKRYVEWPCAGIRLLMFAVLGSQQKASPTPSPSVTDPAATYGAVTGGNGRSPLPCPTCGLPTWDGIHATGHRACSGGAS